MSKSRANWRAKQREKHREEMLDTRNNCGINDTVPYLAVKHIIEIKEKPN